MPSLPKCIVLMHPPVFVPPVVVPPMTILSQASLWIGICGIHRDAVRGEVSWPSKVQGGKRSRVAENCRIALIVNDGPTTSGLCEKVRPCHRSRLENCRFRWKGWPACTVTVPLKPQPLRSYFMLLPGSSGKLVNEVPGDAVAHIEIGIAAVVSVELPGCCPVAPRSERSLRRRWSRSIE